MSETTHRAVVITTDYLDGIEGTSYAEPSEFDPDTVLVPTEVLARFDAAEAAWAEAQAELEHWRAKGERQRNPNYVEAITDDDA